MKREPRVRAAGGTPPAPMGRVRGETLRVWWPMAAVVVLLGLVAIAAAQSSPRLHEVTGLGGNTGSRVVTNEPRADRPTPASPPSEAGPLPVRQSSRGLDTLVSGLCIAVVLAVVAVLGWLILSRWASRSTVSLPADAAPGPDIPSPHAERVVAAVDAGLAELSDADRDPRRAVIACWLRLEEAAAAAGTPRRPDDTSTDLVLRLLREHRVEADVLGGFAEIYRRARYATRTVDEAMRTQALAALRRLRADLTAGRHA